MADLRTEMERQDANLGAVLSDMNFGAVVPDPHQARIWAPALARKLQHLDQHHDHYHLSPAVRTMVKSWHRLVERYEHISVELQQLKQTSSVFYTVGWQNIPANSTSSNATWGVPYSGTVALMRGILLNSQTTPVGGFGKLKQAGIDFAGPTLDSDVIDYDTAAGTAGTPNLRFMDPTPFLHDTTMPTGGRSVQFWVDWVLDPAAKGVMNWVNPDPINTVTVAANILFTSTPCAGQGFDLGQGGMWHRTMHPDVGRLMNRIGTSVFGLQTNGLPVLGNNHHASISRSLAMHNR